MTYDPSYTPADLEAILLARKIANHETVFVGVNSPVPMAAALMARATHAPDSTLLTIAGGINPEPVEFSAATSGAAFAAGSASIFDNLAFYDLVARGGIDITFLGGAQIDRHGHVNSSFIGTQDSPKVRFPGGGGAAFIMPLAKRVVIWRAAHSLRIFVEKCDFVTAAGNLESVITPMCVFDLLRGEMVVASRHLGVSEQSLQENTGFPLDLKGVPETMPPSAEEMDALNKADPAGIRFSEFKT